MKGDRYNEGKPRMSLVSPYAHEGLARVLTYGAKKYAAWNWTKGLSWGETIDSLERHLAEFKKGVWLDPESGLPHIDHALCNAMFLSHFEKTETGIDDRWKHKTRTHANSEDGPDTLHPAQQDGP